MEYYLIRHTMPDVAKGICYGQSDIKLASSFEEEARIIQTKLCKIQPKKVYSSSLQRCVKLAQKFSKNICFDDRLKELNFGNWELKTWHSIPQKELNPWMEDFVNTPATHGESYIQLKTRAYAFFDMITIANVTPVFICTHAGIIRALLARISGKSLIKSFEIPIDYGAVFKIIKKGEKYYYEQM